MDSNKVRIALVLAVKVANTALGTDISLPSGMVSQVISQVIIFLPI